MALTVTNRPQENFSFNPTVQSAPTLAPLKVANAQPQPALRVTQAPPQPPIGVQPVNPQPQINVDNSPRFARLGEAVKLKFPGSYDDMDSGQLGKMVAMQFPGVYDDLIEPASPEIQEPQGVGGIKGFALGATKGALSTAKNLTGLISKAPENMAFNPFGIYSKVTGKINEKLSEANLKPEGTAEKVGFGAEQIGEFFVPAGGVARAGKAIEAGIEGFNLGSKATKALQLGGKVGLGAAEAGGISKLQGQSNKDALINAGIGGALPLAGAVLAPLKNSQAGKFINSLIKPKEVDFRFGKNPGQAVAEAGIIGNTLEGLKNNITKARQSVGKEIQKLLTAPKVSNIVQDVRPALSVIDDEITKAVSRGEQEYVNRLIQFRNGLSKEFTLVDGQLKEVGLKNLKLKPLEIQQLKIQVGEGTRWTGQAFDTDINQVKTKVYAALNDLVEKAAPGTKKLNSKYGNFLTAEKAAEKRIATSAKNNLVSLPNIGFGGIGALTGTVASGGAAIPGLIAGAGAVGASKVLGSTAVKSRVAKRLAKSAGTGLGLIRKTYFGTRPKN